MPTTDELLLVIDAASDLFARSVECDLRGIAPTDAVEPRAELEAESLVLALHLVARWAGSRLGPAGREGVMSGIEAAVAKRVADDVDERVRGQFDRTRRNFGRFSNAHEESGGLSKDTLCFEVGKHVVTEFAPEYPLRASAYSQCAVKALSLVYKHCDEIGGGQGPGAA
ncbi:MAG: hypothetical protein ACHQQR_01570 [Gemmatimonadales bacterium]